jgi:DNA-3-methyladenine glycosylase II
VRLHYGFEALPTKSELKSLAGKWEPYCTVATWYLWQSLREENR